MAKEPTAKQLAARQAASERMKAMHAQKKADKLAQIGATLAQIGATKEAIVAAPPAPESAPEQPPEPPPEQPVHQSAQQSTQAPAQGVTLTQEQFQMMLDRLANRPEYQASPEVIEKQFGQVPRLNSQGGVVGVVERFPIDPQHYNNPVEKLYDAPALSRFALRLNYVIEWSVTPTKYQTAMGTWYIEPRFELTLKRKQLDDDGNEVVKHDGNGKPYHPRIVLGRGSFFNDPPADIMEAEQAGLTLANVETPEGQENMRMYRYLFWLTERLIPKKPQMTTQKRREEVIAGRVYEIDEYSNPYEG